MEVEDIAPQQLGIYVEEEAPRPLGIYHADCFDGVAAAWVLREHVPNIELVAADYRDPVYTDVVGREVYIVDFSYSRQDILDLTLVARHVYLIDHHPRALEIRDYLAGLSPADRQHYADAGYRLDRLTAFVDDRRSGAQLTWDFHRTRINPYNVNPDLVSDHPYRRPRWLDAVGFRDLWQLDRHPWVRATATAMGLLPMSPDAWAEFFDRFENEANLNTYLEQAGEVLLSKLSQDVDRVLSQTQRTIELGGYTVPLINAPRSLISEAAARLTGDHPFVAAYYDDATSRIFSLRSGGSEPFDTRMVSEQYGGGGHVSASGFAVPRDHPLASW